MIGQMWKDLTEDERTEYAEEYEMEKAEYDRAMMQYKNSPAYQVRIVLDRTHDSNSQLRVHESPPPRTTRPTRFPRHHQQIFYLFISTTFVPQKL